MKGAVLIIGVIFLFAGCVEQTEVGKEVASKVIEDPFFGFLPTKVVDELYLVKYDNTSIDDDLAYLACIPRALSVDKGELYAAPLLFYGGESDNPYLNAKGGVTYFLKDWHSYSPNTKVVSINLNEGDIEELKGIGFKSFERINGNATEVAEQLAKNRSKAVLASYPGETKKAEINGEESLSIEGGRIEKIAFNGSKAPEILPTYHNFTVPEGYRYVDASMSWGGFKGKDPDMQLYDWALGQVAASENWNVLDGAFEEAASYVYTPGEWGIGVTYMPTESLNAESNIAGAIANLEAEYLINVTLYPGKDFTLFDSDTLCTNVTIDAGDFKGGIVLRDSNGAVLAKEVPYREPIKLDSSGEGKLQLSAISLDGRGAKLDVSYSAEKVYMDAAGIEDLSNRAIFAAMNDAALLYSPRSGKRFIGFEEIKTDSTDVVFSTAKPYTLIEKENETDTRVVEGGYFFAPAAYAAAFHGVPLTIVENNLSAESNWHSINWLRTMNSRTPPSVGDMVICGRSVYSFLKNTGRDAEGKERILTIAGDLELGPTWDRGFIGKGIPGRIFGTPVDASCWFARDAFYPSLVFQNPGMDGSYYINGSTSERRDGVLTISNPGGEVFAKYPVLQTWVSYAYKFNERASEYWGLNYTTTDGITPYWDESNERIDENISRSGLYYPDMDPSEVVPEYMESMGYSSVFSTNLRATAENLNRGVILWTEIMHGGNRGYGTVGFWSLNNDERNPWRAYEYMGSTEEPDTMAMSKFSGMDANTGSDGIIIAIWEQTPATQGVDGMVLDRYLDNLHSAGFLGGSCLIAHTYLQLALIRHGSSFQIIDPWLTSWYTSLGFELIARGLAEGKTIAEAYDEAIREVGISYLSDGWWWDIYENVVYYGDPGLRVYSPAHPWEMPRTDKRP
ncbi:MAG: hypothetical protein SVE93_04820 [Candidatus Thermoplasmatota archaeon]|nr:hypothetical protein [Candidatus Thermoplasmatota archaeon]